MKFITIVSALCLLDCEDESAFHKRQSDNRKQSVEHILTIDGCRVYRFEDVGQYRYLTTCNGSVAWKENRYVGKIIRRIPHEIQTVRAE